MTGVPAILVLNAGSSSLKFAVFADTERRARLWSGAVERIGLSGARFQLADAEGVKTGVPTIAIADHREALQLVLQKIDQLDQRFVLSAVGHRVVHGGADCHCPMLVDRALLTRLRRLIPLAPLHQPHNIAGIVAMGRSRPDLPQVACFDTAFHHGLPRLARITGLPRSLTEAGIRRFGFHGLSYEYVMGELIRRHGPAVAEDRIIIAHLGNGASMAAIRAGRSIDITMGFSALGGLVMGTRSGDLDPGIVLHLLMEKAMSPQRVQHLLYEESGLLGLSEISRNMAELLERTDTASAVEAVDYFCYQAAKHLAALTVPLGGLDRLVFTGGIGAHSAEIRARIGTQVEHLGVDIDPVRNAGGEAIISNSTGGVIVEAFKTDEELVIAGHVQATLAVQPALSERA